MGPSHECWVAGVCASSSNSSTSARGGNWDSRYPCPCPCPSPSPLCLAGEERPLPLPLPFRRRSDCIGGPSESRFPFLKVDEDGRSVSVSELGSPSATPTGAPDAQLSLPPTELPPPPPAPYISKMSSAVSADSTRDSRYGCWANGADILGGGDRAGDPEL